MKSTTTSSSGAPGCNETKEQEELLFDCEKVAIDEFIFSRYKLSALALAIVAFALGFLIQDLAVKTALVDAKRQAWDRIHVIEDHLRPTSNSHLTVMSRVEATHESLQATERELQNLLSTLDLNKAARVLQASAGEILRPPHFTQFDSLTQGDTDLGEHTLCFLMTVEIDASKAQTCQVTQRGARWVATVDSMTCQVGCLDLM